MFQNLRGQSTMKDTHDFTKRVKSGDVLFGTLVSLPSPEICEILD